MNNNENNNKNDMKDEDPVSVSFYIVHRLVSFFSLEFLLFPHVGSLSKVKTRMSIGNALILHPFTIGLLSGP